MSKMFQTCYMFAVILNVGLVLWNEDQNCWLGNSWSTEMAHDTFSGFVQKFVHGRIQHCPIGHYLVALPFAIYISGKIAIANTRWHRLFIVPIKASTQVEVWWSLPTFTCALIPRCRNARIVIFGQVWDHNNVRWPTYGMILKALVLNGCKKYGRSCHIKWNSRRTRRGLDNQKSFFVWAWLMTEGVT